MRAENAPRGSEEQKSRRLEVERQEEVITRLVSQKTKTEERKARGSEEEKSRRQGELTRLVSKKTKTEERKDQRIIGTEVRGL